MITELLLVLNVMENVLLVKPQQKTVLTVLLEEILHLTVFVMMELLMIMVYVLLVQLNV